MKKFLFVLFSLLFTVSAYKPAKNIEDQVEITGFKELEVAQKDTRFDLKAFTPSISTLRNIITETGSATITQSQGEIVLSTTASGTDVAKLESNQRGVYEAGHVAEAGLGVRIPSQTYSGSQFIRWGYYDDNDGFRFGIDATGVYVEVISGGTTKTKVYQSSWNVDTLDGSGNANNPSGATLDLADGEICNIPFVYYGYGTIEFKISLSGTTYADGSKPVTVHRFTSTAGVSTEVPNLPLTIEVNNNGAANAITAYLGGRQFSIFGSYNPITRITSHWRGNVASVSNSTWVPIISFRKKSGNRNRAQNVRVSEAQAISSENMLIGFISGGTLTTPSWGTPNMVNTAGETVLEADTSATAISGGEFVGEPILIQASNKGAGRARSAEFTFVVPNGDNITMVARSVNTAGNLEASFFSMSEEW